MNYVKEMTMNIRYYLHLTRFTLISLVTLALLSGCGGGSSGSSSDTLPALPALPAPPATGTVGLLFTDKPTDEFSAIKLNVVKAILIGNDDGQQMLFEGSEPIDLLDLTNFSEPVIFGEVAAGTYTKLRLVIDNLALVPKDGGDSIFPALPANGKIDLLDADGFAVLPGRTLLIEIDMDANKSIKITQAGKSNKYNFRPVVKVNFTDGGLQDKLARVEGTVTDIPLDPAGSFTLCDIETPESCVDVATGDGTSIFNDMGMPADFTLLEVGSLATVIGRYEVTTDVVLNALVIEVGGNAEQIKGEVVSAPTDGSFVLLAEDGSDLLVELQTGTKFFDAEGEVLSEAVVIGGSVEVEGVRPEKDNVDDPDLIRAAFVFVEAPDSDQLSGTVSGDPVVADRTLEVVDGDAFLFMVTVASDADIILVNKATAEVESGSFDNLANGQVVELFGTSRPEAMFEADEIIIEVTE
jgi:hypothetical protein